MVLLRHGRGGQTLAARMYAAAILCLAPTGAKAVSTAIGAAPPAKARQEADLVADLRSDGRPFNALRRYQEIGNGFWKSPPNAPDDLVAALVGALSSDDRQQSQMAASLLVRYYERTGVPDAQWPEAIIDALVDGLSDDDIRGGRQIANARDFLQVLFRLRHRRPVDRLQGLLSGEDEQARWAAAVILAEYHAGSVQTAVSEELLRHMAADGALLNEAAAFQAMRRLGADNARDLLRRVDAAGVVIDSQQAALLQCLGAWFDIAWKPPEGAPPQWLASARETGSRVATAALFVYTDRDEVLDGEAIPSPLDRMIRLGPPARGLAAESHWAADWVWWLRRDDPFMGLPGIAASALPGL